MTQTFSLCKLNVSCISYSNGKLAWFDKKLKMSIPVETKVNTIQSRIPPNTESVFYIVNNMELIVFDIQCTI